MSNQIKLITINTICILLLCVLLNTGGLILLKKSFLEISKFNLKEILSLSKNYMFLLGFFANIGSFTLWLVLLAKNDVSLAYPLVVGSNYAAVIATSILLLGEQLTLFKILGVVLIGGGLFFLFLK